MHAVVTAGDALCAEVVEVVLKVLGCSAESGGGRDEGW